MDKNFDQNEYIKEWKKKNMLPVSARFKKEYVEQFKQACEYLGVTQSQQIRKIMEETIMTALHTEISDIVYNPTKEKIKNFIDKSQKKVFVLRPLKSIIKDWSNTDVLLKEMKVCDTAEEVLDVWINSQVRYEEKQAACFLDENESGYTIEETDYYYLFSEWDDGFEGRTVYILK